MLFSEFKKRYRRLPLIPTEQMLLPGNSPQAFKNQLSQWQKRGWLIRLRRGFYLLSDQDRTVTPSALYLANQLYPPSYLSLEYALGHYGLIPEAVAQITSVTTRKTKIFRNRWGDFRYRHLAQNLFWGFEAIKDENGYTVLMAGPEKALLDFFYFHKSSLPLDGKNYRELFLGSYRFQNTAVVNPKKLAAMAASYGDQKVVAAAAAFIKYMRQA
ncbi:type IV toxin-antitoxin system AbiEi family antitoxin domain-containing protein [candidate division TA06 bacterium]|nr:type IV toxin-antitoxin system AbiEi family antitoxin domain-containing protein [candidate division TA06 bacterium]